MFILEASVVEMDEVMLDMTAETVPLKEIAFKLRPMPPPLVQSNFPLGISGIWDSSMAVFDLDVPGRTTAEGTHPKKFRWLDNRFGSFSLYHETGNNESY